MGLGAAPAAPASGPSLFREHAVSAACDSALPRLRALGVGGRAARERAALGVGCQKGHAASPLMRRYSRLQVELLARPWSALLH